MGAQELRISQLSQLFTFIRLSVGRFLGYHERSATFLGGWKMSSVMVDPATLARLSNVAQTVALTDAGGRIVGHFVPTIDPALCQAIEPQISEEELTRREREGGGRPLADILRDLGNRS
jgi:hypothetical protein